MQDGPAKQCWYACEIEKTTNGSGRSAGGQARPAFEVLSSRCIEADVQIDEPKGASSRGKNEAQKLANQETQTQITIADARKLGARVSVEEVVSAPERWRIYRKLPAAGRECDDAEKNPLCPVTFYPDRDTVDGVSKQQEKRNRCCV